MTSHFRYLFLYLSIFHHIYILIYIYSYTLGLRTPNVLDSEKTRSTKIKNSQNEHIRKSVNVFTERAKFDLLHDLQNDGHSLIFKTVNELLNFLGILFNFFRYIPPLTLILYFFCTNTHSDAFYVIKSLLFTFST